MKRNIVFLVGFLMLIVSAVNSQQLTLRIKVPLDNERVPERPLVQGTISDSNAKVWLIVHSMEISEYWVQPAITVKESGEWRTSIYIGRPGSIDVGKHFELMAVANPKANLKEGDVLIEWPEAQAKSQVVYLIRK